MNKLVIIILFSFFSLNISQASNAVFYSKKGELFTVFINGIQQNVRPNKRVKIVNLNLINFRVKIIFKDRNVNPIKKKLSIKQGHEANFIIKFNKKKHKYIVRMKEEIPLLATVETLVVFNNDKLNNSLNVRYYPHVDIHDNHNNHNNNHHQNEDPNLFLYKDYPFLKNYRGKLGCPIPVDKAEFNEVKKAITSKSFDYEKKEVAKQIIKSKCLLSYQVKELTEQFDFEYSRLEFAKMAYHHTYDIDNYYKVYDAFDTSFPTKSLNDYINNINK